MAESPVCLRNATLDYQPPCVSLLLPVAYLYTGPLGQGAGLATEGSLGAPAAQGHTQSAWLPIREAPFTVKASYTDTFCLTGLTPRPTLDPLKAALNSPAAPGVWRWCGQEQEPGCGGPRAALAAFGWVWSWAGAHLPSPRHRAAHSPVLPSAQAGQCRAGQSRPTLEALCPGRAWPRAS